jgi:6-phosphogluconolactonase (cycloisomerase 2 family)
LAIPLGLQVHPTRNVLYVGFVLDQAFGVYTFNADGKLTFVRAVLNVGAGPCWFLTNAAGDRLFVSNNFANSIAVFDISNPLQPAKLATTTLHQGPSNAAPFQIALDRGDRFLHVVTQRATAAQDQLTANALIVLAVARDGTLMETAFVPIPSTTGDRPQGVAAR